MKTARQFSQEQKTYMLAKAAFETMRAKKNAYDKLMDQEGERLGIETPYAILPEGHPMWVEAQRLLDQENEFRKLMYEAAYCLFDWATETTLAKMGTAQQKQQVRAMVSKVKKMAFVETPFEELVDMSMKLAA